MTPEQTYNNPRATKAQLREALRIALGLPEEPAPIKEPQSAYKECMLLFGAAYKNYTGLPYQFRTKDCVALAQVMAKLRNLSPNADLIQMFNALISKLPDWYKKNAFSLPVMNGKFNEIIAAIQCHTGLKSTSNEYKKRIARDLTGQ